MACTQEQDLPGKLDVKIAASVTCETPGTFKQHECGFMIELSDGKSVYATAYPVGFQPATDLSVVMSYTAVVSDTRSQDDEDEDWSCNEGCGGGDDDGNVMLTSCMREAGASLVSIQCITETDS